MEISKYINKKLIGNKYRFVLVRKLYNIFHLYNIDIIRQHIISFIDSIQYANKIHKIYQS